MKAKQWWLDFLKGGSLGLGMIPGVSAGTMAVMVGIYDKMINALADFRKQAKESFRILLPIVLGGVLSCILFLVGVKLGYDLAPFAISCFFAGIIIGSLPTVTKELKGVKISAKGLLLIGIGFLVAAGLGVLSALAALKWNFSLETYVLNPPFWIYLVVIVAGFIAAVACVVPGISGAMILFLLGIYKPIVNLYIDKTESMFVDHSRIGAGLLMTLCLLVGALAGLIFVSKAMKVLLAKKRIETFDVVLGFIVGSVVSMFVSNNMVVIPSDTTISPYWIYQQTPLWEYIVGPILFVLAMVGFYFLTKKMLATSATTSD